ncbi:cell division protein SepF [Candidatus Woesearchaeota archaeon]|nr:cell division protein SepF [Candidatus Woesearchaeota archaeon]
MAEFLSSVRSKLSQFLGGGEEPQEMRQGEQEYVELDTSSSAEAKGKVIVRPYVVENFEDIKGILDSLREGSTIALINIKSLKEKDIIELKRAINKLKKTTDAISGDIAGFGEDYIVATPSFARIHRFKEAPAPQPTTTTIPSEQEIM